MALECYNYNALVYYYDCNYTDFGMHIDTGIISFSPTTKHLEGLSAGEDVWIEGVCVVVLNCSRDAPCQLSKVKLFSLHPFFCLKSSWPSDLSLHISQGLVLEVVVLPGVSRMV